MIRNELKRAFGGNADCSLQLEHRPSIAGVTLKLGWASAHGLGHELVQVVITVAGIVVKGHQVLDAGQRAELERLGDGAVPEADAVRVFGAAVLGIVDEQVASAASR